MCGWQLCEQLFSKLLSHPSNCSQPLQLCHITSRSDVPRCVRSTARKMTQALDVYPPTQEETMTADQQTLPDVFFSGSERSKGGGEGQTEGSLSVALGGLLAGKQVGWTVMREDSWQVQRRLTAKHRWQQGKTQELSLGSRRVVLFLGVWGFVWGQLTKIRVGFWHVAALKQIFRNHLTSFLFYFNNYLFFFVLTVFSLYLYLYHLNSHMVVSIYFNSVDRISFVTADN